jgi:hypothetical protein
LVLGLITFVLFLTFVLVSSVILLRRENGLLSSAVRAAISYRGTTRSLID